MAERTYRVDVVVEVTLNGDEDAALRNVDEILQDAWDHTRGGRLTKSTPWHFEIDESQVISIDDTGETMPIEAPEADDTSAPAQMSYKDALDYAIFSINTCMHPDASDARDIIAMEANAEAIIATLADLRETVKGMQ